MRSESGGTMEWNAGLYYQNDALDLNPAIVIRPHLRTPVRYFKPWGDSEWKSAFGVLTFNFLDNKASIDVGGRYTDVHKFAEINEKLDSIEFMNFIFDVEDMFDVKDVGGNVPTKLGDLFNMFEEAINKKQGT